MIDAPPLLGFAEPLQIAAIAEGVVVVTLAGQTNRNAGPPAIGLWNHLPKAAGKPVR